MRNQVISCGGIFWGVGFGRGGLNGKKAKKEKYATAIMSLEVRRGGYKEGVRYDWRGENLDLG